MEKELEKLVSDVTESPAYKAAISSDTLMRLRSGVPFEGEILPDVLRRALTEAYQAGIRRATSDVRDWVAENADGLDKENIKLNDKMFFAFLTALDAELTPKP